MIDNTSTTIEDKLRQTWQRQRRYVHLRGASRFLIWLVAMIAIDFAIDWGIFFQIRMTARLGLLLLVINVVVLGWVVWYEWLRHLTAFDPLLVSLDVEAQHPELSSLLVSYTQLRGPSEKQPNISRELIEATRSEAVVHTRKLDFREIINFNQLKKLFVVAGCVMLFFGVLSIANQGHFQTLLKRLAGFEASYPTRTQISEVSGDLQVRVGDSVSVIAEAGGVIPTEGTIFIKPVDGSGGWQKLPFAKIGDGSTFERELEEVVKDHDYFVRIGDDQSEVHRIRVVTAPQIVSARLDLSYPSYLEKEAGQSDQLSLEVPQDTTIHWQLSCDKPVRRLLVKKQGASDEETIEATIDETGKKATFSLLADQEFKYSFHWTERESGNDFEYDDVQYRVRVIADKAPEVELLWPKSDALVTVDKTVKLRALAGDDYGLSEAWLVYSVRRGESGHRGEEKRIPILVKGKALDGARRQPLVVSWELKERIKGLQPGATIAFSVEVADRKPDAAEHRRRSATRELTVVAPNRYLEWHQQELAIQLEEIKRVRDREIDSSNEVKLLKDQESPSAEVTQPRKEKSTLNDVTQTQEQESTKP